MTAIPTVSEADQQPLQASKWLKIQMLVDSEEMHSLFDALRPFHIVRTGTVCAPGSSEVSYERFLACYHDYVETLKRGELPAPATFRPLFSSVFSRSFDVFYAVPVAEGQQVVRLRRPAVQLQAHFMDYSSIDGKFRPMVLGPNSITWGVQFSYPQIFQDLNKMEVLKVDDSDAFPNTALFRTIQSWQRKHTVPTPFLVEGQQINIPMRLGKEAFSWVNHHPQLQKKNLQVIT
ncbi:MAG: hypothetical protein H7A37_07215 [Chlamydiales bacterium]|nr:hypothetical protein [Chlamydiales bacterium]